MYTTWPKDFVEIPFLLSGHLGSNLMAESSLLSKCKDKPFNVMYTEYHHLSVKKKGYLTVFILCVLQ